MRGDWCAEVESLTCFALLLSLLLSEAAGLHSTHMSSLSGPDSCVSREA